jgi:hypothetical protein
MEAETSSFVAECFWPDVLEEDVRALDERILACLGPGDAVRYLGSILIREDEVVLCQFAGPAVAIRELALRARIPYERLLATAVASPTKQRSADA